MKYLIMVLLTSSIMVNCKSKKTVKGLDGETIRFSLSKGACFGKCPTYSMEITQSGKATFIGKNFTQKLGTYEKQLSKESFAALEKAFINSSWEEFPENFESFIADLPMIKVGYHNGKSFKVVSGKDNRPEELMQLQFLLESIAESEDWKLIKAQSKEDFNKKPETITIYEEVLIEPRKGLLFAKWLESRSSMGVRLIKKIAPSLDIYLITYNQDVISPKDFLKSLKDDKDIKMAEFNKKTSER